MFNDLRSGGRHRKQYYEANTPNYAAEVTYASFVQNRVLVLQCNRWQSVSLSDTVLICLEVLYQEPRTICPKEGLACAP